uniref:SET domain-containing protein n=1 Tax=Chromera velia CCMP2878 TaxID=1169474 RepID=A0A0G4GDC7_9ALVE|mmetsp:Transcript_34777/g.68659  ORF Transcript_34777/g.68659 Transcript_34777/m.68659 type:complete len:242 (-) Transcript_34777:201-926(-)|eukprot:Cvel_21305.t1-p1 / transcript=Cvel_21305.t1 / gene=Cvel_21305 / organism=Chromera_velia_CCMP2878 / gene_product=hypothetical protein / transcript_product=hypothetical protein / location=Cvel_scaffold1985:30540-33085(-) / protein_length=241 / sequence_SO=supercontig / SO=protein_coding / is_pseudo=false
MLSQDLLEVKDSSIPGAGQGLFLREVEEDEGAKKGDVLCEYTGTHLTLLQFLRTKDRTYVMGGFGLNCHIDAGPHKNVLARYINDNFDSEKLNCKFVKLKSEKKALVVALRDIAPGEELFASYGQVYWRAKEMRDADEQQRREGQRADQEEEKGGDSERVQVPCSQTSTFCTEAGGHGSCAKIDQEGDDQSRVRHEQRVEGNSGRCTVAAGSSNSCLHESCRETKSAQSRKESSEKSHSGD